MFYYNEVNKTLQYKAFIIDFPTRHSTVGFQPKCYIMTGIFKQAEAVNKLSNFKSTIMMQSRLGYVFHQGLLCVAISQNS